MWLGAVSGIIISIVLGVVFITVFYVAQKNLFSGDSEAKFKGSMCYVAAVLVTILAFAMLRFYTMEARMRAKLQTATLTVRMSEWNVWSPHLMFSSPGNA